MLADKDQKSLDAAAASLGATRVGCSPSPPTSPVESIAKMRGRVIEAVGDIDILVQPSDDEIPRCSAQAGVLAEERPHMALGRHGEPQEVADVFAFLCSEQASFQNGANYCVDSRAGASI